MIKSSGQASRHRVSLTTNHMPPRPPPPPDHRVSVSVGHAAPPPPEQAYMAFHRWESHPDNSAALPPARPIDHSASITTIESESIREEDGVDAVHTPTAFHRDPSVTTIESESARIEEEEEEEVAAMRDSTRHVPRHRVSLTTSHAAPPPPEQAYMAFHRWESHPDNSAAPPPARPIDHSVHHDDRVRVHSWEDGVDAVHANGCHRDPRRLSQSRLASKEEEEEVAGARQHSACAQASCLFDASHAAPPPPEQAYVAFHRWESHPDNSAPAACPPHRSQRPSRRSSQNPYVGSRNKVHRLRIGIAY